MFHRPLAFMGSVAAALLGTLGMGHRAVQARPLAPAPSQGKGRYRHHHPRNAGVFAGHAFLHRRDLHPGRSSSIRKLQRAFRIAGRSFTPGRG